MTCTDDNCVGRSRETKPTYSPAEGVVTDMWLTTDNSSTNATEPESYTRDENLARWEIFMSALILLVALFGNSIVVHSLWRRRKKLTRMHFFILHLCIADLLTCVLSSFPQMMWDITFLFYAPDAVCRLVKYGQVFPMYLSTYILVMTAIDRYIAICHPLLGLRGDYTQRMRIMIIFAYGISFLFTIPQMIIFRNITVAGGHQCHADFMFPWGAKAYITFFITAVYVIPSLILGVTYGMVSYTVWVNMTTKGEKKRNNNASSSVATTNIDDDDGNGDGVEVKASKASSEREDPLCRKHGSAARVSRAKVKTIKMTLTIVCVYVACWTPFSLSQIWALWHPQSAPFNGVAFTIIMLLANLNSCTNPWIYLAFSDNVKRELLQTFGCLKPIQANPSGFKKPTYPNDRGTATDDNSSRYVSTTSHVGSKTLYSSVDSGRDASDGRPGYGYGYSAGTAGHTRDI